MAVSRTRSLVHQRAEAADPGPEPGNRPGLQRLRPGPQRLRPGLQRLQPGLQRLRRRPRSAKRRAGRIATGALATICALVAGLASAPHSAAAPGQAVDPAAEMRNLLTWAETTNALIGKLGSDFVPGLLAATRDYQLERLDAVHRDPERQPNPNNCTLVVSCPVNPERTPDKWRAQGGQVEPVLFTSRSGGTLSGHIWAMGEGGRRRPGVIITPGSIWGFEQAYWYLAQDLARAGYLVLSYDPSGQGMSDQFGEAPDQLEQAFGGMPLLGLFGPQSVTGALLNGTHWPVGDGLGLGGNGLPFYDTQIDALNFLLSTPEQPYSPVPSRSTGTSHAAKQERRAAAGLIAAHNPMSALLDPERIGVTGHSYGAIAASWNSQADPRIGAAVGLDSACVPGPPLDEAVAFMTAPVNNIAGVHLPVPLYGFSDRCFGQPNGPVPALNTPLLHVTGDYLTTPAPYVRQPDRQAKSGVSLSFSQAGVDSGAVIIRGGNHFDASDATGILPASLRGIDMGSWFVTAWFDKYLKHDPAADDRLINPPWRNDPPTGAVDPSGDPNLFSYHYASRLDLTLEDGTRYRCEDLRAGCP
ncbi:hypothetical protein V7968_19225 [Nocardia vulneris]|uniref:hypothetical protein n=1 Tax=Nocardia vulneris TaxID=1141657 RepID=UPI0030CDF25B